MLVCLLMTGVFGTAITTEIVSADDVAYDRDHLPTLIYNSDSSGSRISQALDDSTKYFGPLGSDSHIWFGDISNYNINDGYHGDAYWRVVDKDSSYNGTKGMMFLTSEFTFTSVRSEQGAMATTYKLLFNDVEKTAITKEGHTPTRTEDFQFRHPTWKYNTDVVNLDDNKRLFSLSVDELQQHFSNEMPTYRGSTSKTNAESAAYALDKRQHTVDLRNEAEQYWLRQRGYYYSWDIISGKTLYIEGLGNVSNEYSFSDYIVNVNKYSCGTRPSFTLDLSKVLFMSLAKDSDGAKSAQLGFKEVETFERNRKYGEDWKLTLLDDTRELAVDSAEYTDNTQKYVKIHYSSKATLGNSDYISAFITDENNLVKYYGRVFILNSSTSLSGEFILDLSNINTSDRDSIYLFSEKASGDYLTDYASKPVKLNITLKQDFPVVTFEKGNDAAAGITTPISLKQSEEEITLPKCGYTLEGMAFLGWKKQGRTTRFLPGEKVTIKADTTFTAEWGKSWRTLQDLIDLPGTDTIVLDDDYYATEGDTWLIVTGDGKKITIDLNGHKLDRNAVPSSSILDSDVTTVDKGSVFLVSDGSELTIIDSKGGGLITGGCAHAETNEAISEMGATAGGITVWNGATVNFKGGTIKNNYGELAGGVVVENGGTFIFEGGTITQNNGMMAGAVIALNRQTTNPTSTFTMTGGEITSNFNKGFGTGGVYIIGNSKGNFQGGQISSNVGLMSGGVLLMKYDDATPQMNVSGSPVITNNMSMANEASGDVFLDSGMTINVTGTLNDNAKIGVYTVDKPTATSNVQITTGLNGKGNVESFISSDDTYIVIEGSYQERAEIDGEAYLTKKIDLVFYEDADMTKKIKTVPSFTEKLITLPDCTVTKEGKNFTDWTIEAVDPGTDSLIVKAKQQFYVVRNFITSDQKVNIYANWEDHTHVLNPIAAVAPTCENPGNIAYWKCEGCGKYFSDAEGKNEITLEQTVIDATGHDWTDPTYTWADNYSTVTAERVCRNDSSHKDTLTKNTTSSVTKEAKCEEKGETTYTATFSETGFANQTKTVANIEALGHNWGAWVIDKEPTSSEEGSKSRTCQRQGCSKTETASIPKKTHVHDPQPVEGKAATCEENGYVAHWKCSDTTCGKLFLKDQNNEYYEVQDSDIILYSRGHIYINPEYEWGDDHSSVTATITCQNDPDHKITETHTTTETVDEGQYKIEVSSIGKTCTTSGRTIYIATFKDPHFTTQTSFVVTDAPTGHKWGELVVDTAPTCSTVGKGHQNCENDNSHVKDNIVIPTTGHDWYVDDTDPQSYVWAEDNSSVTAKAKCRNNCGETLTETKTTTATVIKPASDTEEGIVEYRASFDNVIFADQTRTAAIPKRLAVTFMVNGSVYAKTLVDMGANVEKPQDPSKLCYDFKYWYATDSTNPFDFNTETVTSNLTLNAKFDPTEYTISYELNGGTLPEGYPSKYTIESGEITLVEPAREHSIFLGWTGTDLELVTKDVVIPAGSFGNRTYYANFKVDSEDVKVNLDPKDGQLDVQSITKGSWLPYGDLPEPIPNGENVIFDAWYTSEDFSDQSRINKDTVVSTEAEHTIYARYKFPVYFDGSDQPVDPAYVYTDQADKRISKPEYKPEKEGYAFDYWAKANGEEFDFTTEEATPGLHLMASYYRYVSTINDNVWVLEDSGMLHFRFVRYQFMISEGPSNKNLPEDFIKNGKKIYVDGVLLSEGQYSFGEGSLYVDLKDFYLNKLSVGRHDLRIEFTDGSVSTTFLVRERSKPSTDSYVAPKTGLN